MYLHGNTLLEVLLCAQEADNDKEKKSLHLVASV